jgi:photosystem II stability/assembly factor-like uncharacterized protein
MRSRRLLIGCIACSFLYFVAVAFAQQSFENLYGDMRWRMIGPFRGGRTRAAAGVPNQPNVFYVGAVNGGVWKSNDFGRTWAPIFDHQDTQSIGAIAVAPSDPNIVYVASGEGLHRPDLSVGNGIYKSRDAGKSWTHLGLRDGKQIPAIAVDPHDPNRLFAAVLGHPYGPNEERGIFRSTDGGESWQKVLYKDANTGGSDVEIDPSNPNVIYASLWEVREGPWEDKNQFEGTGGGLFKSTDGGTTWRPLKNGFPADLTQLDVTIAASQPTRLYATVATTVPGDYGSDKGLGFYRSDDAGENWYRVTTDPRPAMRIGGGDLAVPKVDPKNPDVVYSTSIVTVRSIDGGKTWTSLRGAPGGDDYQNIWINPNDPNIILLVSDQGAIVSVNGGETWSSWFNQPTAQLYHVAVTNDFPYQVCGGQQESGSVCISSRGNDGEITFRDWHPVGVIEYGYVAPDPVDSDVIYGGGRNEVSKFYWSTGQVENVTPIPLKVKKYRSDRTEPLMFSPVDPHVLYYAANSLFKTTDGGRSWQSISPDLTRKDPGVLASVGDLASKNPKGAKQRGAIYAVAPSFLNLNTIWAGTDDGLIWKTGDGGKNWNDVTPPELSAWSKVTQISASHFDGQTAYASVSGFRIDNLHPYIYRTHDGGKTWKLITEGLPADSPVDTVREDPVRKGLLFAGTETAVWVSFDNGDHWQSLQLNLPHTSMRDLLVHENDLIVATHGRSFWILDDIAPLRQLAESNVQAKPFLFQPAPAFRIRRDTNTDTPIPPDEPAGENPPSGAIIDYYLPQRSSGPVSLEILDTHDRVIRRYSSDDKPDATQTELEKQLIPLYWIQMPKILPATAGMHRWVWDFRYPAPTVKEHEFPIAAVPRSTPREPLGPIALPGQYTVRLTANSQIHTAPLAVKMDPRVKATQNEIEQEFDLAMRLAPMVTRSSQAVMHSDSILEQIKKLSSQANGPLVESLKSLGQKVTAILGDPDSAQEPNLRATSTDVGTLYADAQKADAAPNAALVAASAETAGNLANLMKRWEELKTKDLPDMNRQLREALLPEINPESIPQAEQPHGDEE